MTYIVTAQMPWRMAMPKSFDVFMSQVCDSRLRTYNIDAPCHGPTDWCVCRHMWLDLCLDMCIVMCIAT